MNNLWSAITLLAAVLSAMIFVPPSIAADSSDLSSEQLVVRQLAIVLDQPIPKELLPAPPKTMDELQKMLTTIGMRGTLMSAKSFEQLPDGGILLTFDKTHRLCALRRRGDALEVFAYPDPPERYGRENVGQLFPHDFLIVTRQTQFLLAGKGIARLSSNVVDFGELEEGKVFDGEVTITNTGREKMTIRGVRGSCGCISIREHSFPVLDTGQSAKISFEFASEWHAGIQELAIAVDTDQDSAMVELTGYVETELSYFPRSIYLDMNGTQEAQFNIHVLARDGINIDPLAYVKVVDPGMSYEIVRGRSLLWKVNEDIVKIKWRASENSSADRRGHVEIGIKTAAGAVSSVSVPITIWIDNGK